MRCFAAALVLALLAPLAWADSRPVVQRAYSGRDSRFIEMSSGNAGAVFRAVAPGKRLAFSAQGIEVQLKGPRLDKSSGGVSAFRYSFDGGAVVAPQGISPSPTVYHWLVGEQANWRTGLKSYGGLTYKSVWPGVNAVFSGDASGFKYHFELAPGVDPAQVAMRVEGADSVRVDATGALEWRFGGERVVDAAPVSFQMRGTEQVPVETAYRVESLGPKVWRIGFTFKGLDRSSPLVIDPAWVGYSGLVGGSAQDQVYAVTRDSADNTYACGVTRSSNLPLASGFNGGGDDAFMVKFNAAGVAQMVTYIGGSGDDLCTGIALDGQGRIYLAGGTSSTNFPVVGTDGSGRFRRTKTGTDRDAFVMRLSSSGASIGYAGFIGGAENDQANGIAVDGSNRAYVTGFSTCTNDSAPGCVTAAPQFPVLVGPRLTHGGDTRGTGGMDAFVARVAADGGTLEYAGFIGGNGGAEMGHAIVADSDGSAYVAGETDSATGLTFPAGLRSALNSRTVDASDGFVAKVASAGGSLINFTLLTGAAPAGGESGADRALAIALDSDGSVLAAGETDSVSFPANNSGTGLATGPQTTNAGGMDGFVLRLNSDLSAIVSASYIGGTGYDAAQGVATDGSAFYVTGSTNPGTGFPAVAQSGLLTTRPGGQDGFLTKSLKATPNVMAYAGFLGTSAGESMRAISAAITTGGTVLSVGGVTSTAGPVGLTNPTEGALNGSGASNGLVLRVDPFGPPASVTIQTGATQNATINSAFAAPLSVRVTDVDSLPLVDVVVTFTAPSSNASTNPATTTATTNASGIASIMATANSISGSYSVTAQTGAASNTFSLTNDRANQAPLTVIATPASLAYNGTSALSVSGGSGTGAVSYTVTAGSGFCTISGSTLSGIGVGGCTVTASKVADASYNAAAATVEVTVSQASQAITFGAQTAQTYVLNGSFAISPVATGGASGNAIVYSSTTTGVCTVSGSTVAIVTTGTCTIAANQAGNTNYTAATQVTQNVAINAAAQSINFTNPGSQVFATAPTLSATATSGLTPTFTSSTSSVCAITSGGTLSFVATGTCTITASQAGNSYFNAATPVPQSFNVTAASQATLSAMATPASIVYNGTSALSATGGSGAGAVSYAVTAGSGFCAVSGSTLTAIGVGGCTVTATKAADAGYSAATATVGVTVSKASQASLTVIATPASLAYSGTSALSVSGGSGTGAVSYTVTAGGGFCTISGSTLSGIAMGSCTVTATKAADTNYLLATGTLQFSVGKAAQSIIFGALPDKTLGAADFTVSATASSSLAVSFASQTNAVCTLSASTVHMVIAGLCTIQASQPGDASFEAANSITQSFNVGLPPGTSSTVAGMAGSTPASAGVVSSGWVFAAPGNGATQTAGFIALQGHVKSPATPPPTGMGFPYGLFDFVALNGAPGSALTVTITLDTALPANAQYWKYGPTAANTVAHWYPFPGVVISGKTITLTIVDGGLGDDDLIANGTIVDAGGIAVLNASAVPGIPTLSALGQWVLMFLLLLAGWKQMRRVSRR